MPDGTPPSRQARPIGRFWPWIGMALLFAGIVAVRLTGPTDLLDNDQLRPASYTTDVVANGQWIVQRDTSGDIASKPPLTVWIASAAALVAGGAVTPAILAVPSIIGLVGSGVVVFLLARRHHGDLAAWWGVMALALSPMGFKQAILARTDSFYGLAGALCGWALWHAMRRGGSAWVWFWMAATIAMLTKGPVAALLPVAGLMAWVWPRQPPNDERGIAVRTIDIPWHIAGAAILLGLAGGWFFLAWRTAGDAFLDKVIGRELVGHIVTADKGSPMTQGIYLPTLYYLSRYAPGSLLTAIGLWAVMARPSSDAATRRFDRFLWWWFVVGIAAFSLAPHQRADLMTPIWVAGSILAGRTMAGLVASVPSRGRIAIAAAWIVVAFGGAIVEHHARASGRPEVRGAIAIRRFAGELIDRFGGPPPVAHVSENSSFQFFLGRRVERISEEDAMELLADAAPRTVAIAAKSGFQDRAIAKGIAVYPVAWSDGPDRFRIVIVGNAAAAAMPQWSSDTEAERDLDS